MAPTLDFPAFVGNYRLSANEVIAIAEWELDPSSPHVLAFTNLKTGRIGVLTELGGDEFALHEGLLAGPQVAAIHFVRSRDRAISLIYTPSSGQPLRAQRVETRSEELTLDAGDVRLGATLYMPAGHGRFPVIVLVPAGALGRTAAATFPNFFVAEGFGVLVYDRRPGPAPLAPTQPTWLPLPRTFDAAPTSIPKPSACGATVKAVGYPSSRLPGHQQSLS